jgi:hypothetical protein
MTMLGERLSATQTDVFAAFEADVQRPTTLTFAEFMGNDGLKQVYAAFGDGAIKQEVDERTTLVSTESGGIQVRVTTRGSEDALIYGGSIDDGTVNFALPNTNVLVDNEGGITFVAPQNDWGRPGVIKTATIQDGGVSFTSIDRAKLDDNDPILVAAGTEVRPLATRELAQTTAKEHLRKVKRLQRREAYKNSPEGKKARLTRMRTMTRARRGRYR